PKGNLFSIRLSPDGRRLATEWSEGPGSDIWVHDLVRGTKTRLTFDPGDDASPVWSADGSRVYFASRRGKPQRYRIYERPSDGSGEDRLVYESSRDVWPSDVSADGRWLGFIEGLFASRTSTDLYVLPLAGAKTPLPVVTG